ncbi:MAG: cytochrome b/b6 domain-containing protein [Betaproteobacteria bacterium]|nr:cytochrome b/b6 domain-containing protein [Betaproteobacteria bacterium]
MAGNVDSTQRIYLYNRYERFWHWSQAALIIIMMITGFEVHGSYENFGFQRAVEYHTLAAWALLTLWAFTIFWQFTTGEWKQYIPTLKKVDSMVRYYVFGIFVNAPHPFRKTAHRKHNPLQRLAYLALLSLVSPIIWGSGLLYLFHAWWKVLGVDGVLTLEWVAFAHTAGAFMMLVFFILHVYLTTTGHTPLAHIKTMITGWEQEEHD